MRKNPIVAEKRRAYIKSAVDNRHKSENIDMAINRIAGELFLSPSTVWKDYLKEIPVNYEQERGK